jgi:hypothetical protein
MLDIVITDCHGRRREDRRAAFDALLESLAPPLDPLY